MDSKRALIIFVGPTASGKTTRARALCRKYGSKCYFSVIPPFGGLAYLMLRFMIALLTLVHPEYRRLASVKKAVAFLEVFFTELFRRILPLAILLDSISIAIRALALYMVGLFKRVIVIEDFIPQIIVDHVVYAKAYTRNDRLYRVSTRVMLSIATFFREKAFNKCFCISLKPQSIDVLTVRANSRGELISNVLGTYNLVIRGRLAKSSCRHLGYDVYEVY